MFNALDLMDNKQFLEELKFGTGDGHLRYYLYNWKCPEMPSEKVGVFFICLPCGLNRICFLYFQVGLVLQ